MAPPFLSLLKHLTKVEGRGSRKTVVPTAMRNPAQINQKLHKQQKAYNDLVSHAPASPEGETLPVN